MDVRAAHQRLVSNAQALISFAGANLHNLTAGVDKVNHGINSAYKTKLLQLVRATLARSVLSDVLEERRYEELQRALEHVRYISFDELRRANEDNVALLNAGEPGEYCLMVPADTEKSNMWLTLLAATTLRPAYAACATCNEDKEALRRIDAVDCLFFDDCIYSGSQMEAHLRGAREACPKQRFYCVPAFWHVNHRLEKVNMHPMNGECPRNITLCRWMQQPVHRLHFLKALGAAAAEAVPPQSCDEPLGATLAQLAHFGGRDGMPPAI